MSSLDFVCSILSHACVHSAVRIVRSSRSLARQASACVLHWPGHVLPLAELAMLWASHGQSLRVSGLAYLCMLSTPPNRSHAQYSVSSSLRPCVRVPLLHGVAPAAGSWIRRWIFCKWVEYGLCRVNLWLIVFISFWYREDMVVQCCSCPYLRAAFFCGGFFHPLQADCSFCGASFSFTAMTGTPWADKAALHLLRWPVRRSLAISFLGFPCIANKLLI